MNKLFNFEQVKGKWHKFPSFNLGGGAKLYKNFVQKLLAVSLCMSVVLLGMPLGGQNVHVVEAADADAATIPNTMFLTKDALLELCKETNVVDGKPTGLLATGTGTDVKLRINFGRRPKKVHYYDADREPTEVAAGPTTWLVAGSEKFTPDGQTNETDGLVLYSEAPLVSAYDLRGDSNNMNSIFQPDYFMPGSGVVWVSQPGQSAYRADFNDEWGTYSAKPEHVHADHWGASNLRKVLNAIYEGSTLGDGEAAVSYAGFFNEPEKDLMAASTITTFDHQTDSAVEYTTTDFLYAPRHDSSGVDSSANLDSALIIPADELRLHPSHLLGCSWLRSSTKLKGSHVACVNGDGTLTEDWITSKTPAVSAAFRLDLADVLFMSAAASSDSDSSFTAISADTPMTLRVTSPSNSELDAVPAPTVENRDIKYTGAPDGARLMVLATGSDGTTYQYFKDVTGTGSLALSDLASNLPAGMTYTARAWLETDVADSDTLTYATETTDEFEFCVPKLNVEFIELSLGEQTSFDLAEKLTPAPSTDHTVTWKSNNDNVATVDKSGKVTAVGPGETIITVTSNCSGLSATCTVTVSGTNDGNVEPPGGGVLPDEGDGDQGDGTQGGDNQGDGSQGGGTQGGGTQGGDNQGDGTQGGGTQGGGTQGDGSQGGGTQGGGTQGGGTQGGDNQGGGTQGDGTQGGDNQDDDNQDDDNQDDDNQGDDNQGDDNQGDDNQGDDNQGDDEDLPTVDRSTWGTKSERSDGVTQYVVEDPTSPNYGMTSVEIHDSSVTVSSNGTPMLWLHETSGSSSAWYGISASSVSHLPAGGYRFYVQWLQPGDPGYEPLLDQLDDHIKQRVEDDNGWLFNMGIRAPDGTDVHYLKTHGALTVNPIVYVQIGDDWDVDDLNAYYIASGADENVPVDYLTLDYPEGTDTFGVMKLSHFSPYFLFDELNASELAALERKKIKTGDLSTQLAALERKKIKTGDLSTHTLISGLSIVLVSALGIMLRLITNKKKFEE